MKALEGFAWLLVLQSTGEALARLLSFFPGPVVGMVQRGALRASPCGHAGNDSC